MDHRYVFLSVVLSFSCLALQAQPVVGQEHQSAQQLFDQGMQQYTDGDLIAAQQTFRRIDPLQLDKQQRLTMYETIQNIDRQIRQGADPKKLLRDAQQAQDRGDLSRALALYQSVARHPSSSTQQKQTATARLAEVRRRLNADLTRARQSIDEAAADIQAGRYREAQRKLQAIKASGLDLGWFENERIERQLIMIADRLANDRPDQAQTPQPPPPSVTPPATSTPPIPPAPQQQPAQSDQEAPQQRQRELELAQQKRSLAQWEQQLALRDQALRQQAQQAQAAQRQQEQAAQAQWLQQQREQEQRTKAAQQQRQRELAQREQELARREQELAQQARAQRERAQREQAQREQKLAERQRQLAQLEQQFAQQQPPGASPAPPQHQQHPTPAQDQQTQREHQQRLQQLAEREQELAQWEQQIAQKEQQLHQHDRPPVNEDDLLQQARVIHIQDKLTQARQAEQARQFHLAAKLYQEVLEIDPNNPQAQAAAAAAQAQSAVAVGPQGVLDTEIQARTIRTNAAIAEFEELMNRARNLLESQSFAAARESAQQAKITLDLNQRFLPTSRYRSLRDNAVNLAAQIGDAERIAQEAQQRELEMARRTEAEKRRQEALQAQRDETQRLIQRSAALRREQKYDQALELLNQALFLDPNNVAAQAMKEMIEDSRLLVQARNRLRNRSLTIAQQATDNIEATTPVTDLMAYPPDWPQLTAARLSGLDPTSTESEVNRRVALKLQDSVPINFESNKLVNIIEYLRNTTGVNFFVNWPILESIGVGKDMPITLQLTNVPVEQALRLILQHASAGNELEPIGYSVIEGVVTISTERDLSKTTDIRPYDIRDLLVQVPNFDQAPEFDLNAALSNTNSGGSSTPGGGGGGGEGGGIFGGEETREEQPTRAETIEQITNLIQDTVGKKEDWETQGGDGSIRELNGNLIIKTTPKNHRQIGHLLAQLRETRAIQIAIEGRFLLVEQNFLDEIGVDLDVTIQNGNANKWGPVSINQDSIAVTTDRDLIATNITPDIFRSKEETDSAGNTIRTIHRALDFVTSYSILDDIQVNLMIRATQANRRAIELTAPRLTLFNGQRSYVVVARQVSFISDLEPIPDSAGFDPTLSVTQSGVILDVEATVSADRRYVTMTVQPSLARLLEPIKQIEQRVLNDVGRTTVNADGTIDPTVVEFVPLTAFIEAPELELTTVKTSVSVPDRGTLLIGGQRVVADVEVETGVPILSKIPVLNRFFTNTSTIKDERTLLILIKPTVIIQSEEEETHFPGLLQNPQKFGVGRRF